MFINMRAIFYLHCVSIFQIHILNSTAAKFLVPGVLGILGPFAFLFSFSDIILGGRDSLG